MTAPPSTRRAAQYRELLGRYFAPQWPSAAALFGCLLSITGFALIRPRLLASFIDRARGGASSATLLHTAIVFLVVAIAGQLIGVVEAYLAERVALTATNHLRVDLTRHCLGLDLSFHNEHPPGELIQRIDGDVAKLTNFFSRFVIALLGNGLLLVGVLVMVMLIDVRLGLALAAFSGSVLFGLYRLRAAARPHWERFMEAQADQAGFLEEHLSGTEDIRSSGATGYAMRRFFEHARTMLRREQRAVLVSNAVGGSSALAFTFGTAGALAAAVALFHRGSISIGSVFLVFIYTQMLSRPINAINREIQDLQTATAAVGRVYELLETKPTILDGPAARPGKGALSVELAGVGFEYEDKEPVLAGVTLRVEPGRVLGVLGRTGSGKTTVSRLLLRFYDAGAGSVRVGEVDVRDFVVAQLRERIGLVTQEVQLFQASVRDNITFFDAGVSDARIAEVVTNVGLGEWLASLPAGLDTPVASGGRGLSGGEAQLLAFARVFLHDPGLVILDEATSRIDPATERLVEHAVARLFEGRTAIVIAHRLRTVMRADDIVIMADGRVVEYGSREALMRDSTSRFAQLLEAGLEDVLA